MKKLRAAVLVFASLVFAAFLFSANAPVSLHPPSVPIPVELFGMHIHRAATTTPWPPIPFGTWRLWDTRAAWPWQEPEKGKWDFELTDKFVELAEQHHVEVVFPLAMSPSWASARPEEKSGYSPGNAAEPRDLNDWRNYVRTIATRYKGRVHAYEIWNEPNLKNFYTGSLTQLVQLVSVAYQTLKEIDPAIIVCSPAFTAARGIPMFEQYMKAGGTRYADVIGYHLYVSPGPPEEIVGLIQQVREIMTRNGAANKPLWDTEFGWAVPKPFPTEELAAAYVARAYVLHWAAGVSRLFWYSWDNQKYGLQMTQQDDRTLKPAAIAYGELQKWLVGAQMVACENNSDGTWISELSRPGNYHGWIVWNPARTTNFTPTGSWKMKRVRDLTGKMEAVRPGSPSVPIGPSPVLLENQAP